VRAEIKGGEIAFCSACACVGPRLCDASQCGPLAAQSKADHRSFASSRRNNKADGNRGLRSRRRGLQDIVRKIAPAPLSSRADGGGQKGDRPHDRLHEASQFRRLRNSIPLTSSRQCLSEQGRTLSMRLPISNESASAILKRGALPRAAISTRARVTSIRRVTASTKRFGSIRLALRILAGRT